MLKRFSHKIVNSLVFIIGYSLHLAGRKNQLRLGNLIGYFFWFAAYKRRRIVLTNIKVSLGSFFKNINTVNLGIKAFCHLGCVLVEFLVLPFYSRRELEKLIKNNDYKYFSDAIDQKKGAILLTAHLGNWELLGAFFSRNDLPLNAINRKQKGIFADIITRIREDCGTKLVFKGFGVREAIKCLKRAEILAILADQGGGIRVPFLFRTTDMPTGTATLSAKLNVPVIPGFLMRKGNGFVFETGAPINLINTGNVEADIKENTRRIAFVISSIIIKYPEQWFWLHKMWKEEY